MDENEKMEVSRDLGKLAPNPRVLDRENVCLTVEWKAEAGEKENVRRHPVRCWVPPGPVFLGVIAISGFSYSAVMNF